MARTLPIDYSSRSPRIAQHAIVRPAPHDDSDSDPLRPARGVLHGALIGAAFWAMMLVLYWLA